MWIRKFFPQLCLLLVFIGPSSKILPAQTSDTIKVIKSLGTVYKYDGEYLGRVELRKILKQDAEAFAIAKKGDGFYALSEIIGFAGGFMLGYPLGQYVATQEADWELAWIGAGLIGLSIPFGIVWKDHEKKAVRQFNANRQYTTYRRWQFKLGLSTSGIGVQLSF